MWNYLEDASNYQGHADRILIPQTEPELLAILAEAQAAANPITTAGEAGATPGDRNRDGTSLCFGKNCKQLGLSLRNQNPVGMPLVI